MSALTVTLVDVVEYRRDVSVPELFCFPDQSLFDDLVSGQHHHFFGSKVHREHRPIFLGQLESHRIQISFLYWAEILFAGRGSTHLAECLLRSAEVELQQVAKQGQRPGSRGLPPRGPADAAVLVDDAEDKQEGDAGQQGGGADREQQIFLHRHPRLRRRALLGKNARRQFHVGRLPAAPIWALPPGHWQAQTS